MFFPDGARLGGAPANLAIHAASLGAKTSIVTRLGQDDLGRAAAVRLKASNVSTDLVQWDAERATGTVQVSLNEDGVPQFTIAENVAWDVITATEQARKALQGADAVCFGSLAQRALCSRQAIQDLLEGTNRNALRLFDFNLRPPFVSAEVIESSLRLANALKINEEEMAILRRILILAESERHAMEELAGRFDLKLIALTRGSRGSRVYLSGQWSDQGPEPVTVVDTVGAGDAFTATLIVGLLQGRSTDEAHALAATVARYVCSQAGATPALPPTLLARFAA